MQQRDLEMVEGWMAAERGEPRDPHATAPWREGYDLKRKQLAERFRYRKYQCQPALVQ
mgnify:CR=1 FL=1